MRAPAPETESLHYILRSSVDAVIEAKLMRIATLLSPRQTHSGSKPGGLGYLYLVGRSDRRVADHVDRNCRASLRRPAEIVDYVVDDANTPEGDGQQVMELDSLRNRHLEGT